MKTKSYFLLLFVLAASLVGCNKYDTIAEEVIVGYMAPQVYWNVESSTVTAGNPVPFTTQYYTTGTSPITKLEVWYSVKEDISKVVSCPWTVTFSYSYSSAVNELKRISQLVSTYEQNSDYWNDSLHAYSFNATFPTSNTLSSTSWNKPTSFDSLKMVSYFGPDFMTEFKDSLYGLMQVKDFQKMYEGLGLVEHFNQYCDSTINENTGQWDYYFPGDTIPTAIADIYKSIPFSDLIYNSSNANYDVEYNRTYLLDAVIKCYDEQGTAGTGLTKEITLN